MTTNRYPATCAVCGNTVPARGGTLSRGGIPEPAVRAITGWRVTHLACATGTPAVVAITLNSGVTLTRNARGRCEDAPCCGCCTF